MWFEKVLARHTRTFSRSEFLKAIRALSARYVEGRATLSDRSPLDSAGKRAAFAAYFAALHFLIARRVLHALQPAAMVDEVLDIGAGTGSAGLAWASLSAPSSHPIGIDVSTWALGELRWNAAALGVTCRTERLDAAAALTRLTADRRRQSRRRLGVVCGWSLNEMTSAARAAVCTELLAAASRGAAVLVLEPLAFSAVPWWPAWQARVAGIGGRSDQWRFPLALPPALADLDRDAGFRRDHLSVRTTFIGPARLPGGAASES